MRPTIPHPDLTYLSPDNNSGIHLELGRDNGRPVDFLKIECGVAAEHAAGLAKAIWNHLPDLRPVREEDMGEYTHGSATRHSHPLALTQLLLAYHLMRKYTDLSKIPFAPPVAALSRLQDIPAPGG